MKTCPVCDSDFPDQHNTCPTDGAVLIVSHELAVGSLVRGKYRITRKLGQGGMGVVYLAEHLLLGKLAALKFLAVELSRNPQFIKRFRNEARAAFQLRHPSIVEVMDLDQAEDGSLFIAMEFVEGSSLRAVIQAAPGGLSVERALAITRGIASGLAAAHARGTVHRDIKPDNILLTLEAEQVEQPKVLDFGIAAMLEGATALSQTRGLMLTAEYASPEQWRGTPAADLDGRTDLYALGGVLYEMLTGRTPFHAHNMEGWMFQHLQETPPPPSLLRPELADWIGLDDLVMRLLAKNRDDRPSDAEALYLLDAAQYGVAVRPPEPFVMEETARPQTRVEEQWPRQETINTPIPMPPAPPEPVAERYKARSGTVMDTPPVIYSPKPDPKDRTARKPNWLSRLFPGRWPRVIAICLGVVFVAFVILGQAAGISDDRWMSLLVSLLFELAAVALWTQWSRWRKWIKITFILPGLLLVAASVFIFYSNFSTWVVPYLAAYLENDPKAYSNLGEDYFNGFALRRDPDRGAYFLGKACDGGSADVCHILANMFSQGNGIAENQSDATKYYIKACDLGKAYDCGHVGFKYKFGREGVNQDYSKALEYFTKGCDKNNGTSCAGLGELYLNGEGVEKNVEKANHFFGKSSALQLDTDGKDSTAPEVPAN
jgi:serine/threonine-protein kinase